jgi:hypothetical protein
MDGLGSINWWGFTPAMDLQLGVDNNVSQGKELTHGNNAAGL